MSDSTYDKLKWFTHLLLPTLGVCLFIFSVPEEILGGILILITILEVTLQIISRRYEKENEGELIVKEDVDGHKSFSLKLGKEPDELAGMSKVFFKVKRGTA